MNDLSTVLMSPEEARQAAETIRADLVNSWHKLRDFDEREGWRALGYESFLACIEVEFKPHIERLKEAQRPLMRQLRANGATYEAIAGAVGVGRDTAWRATRDVPISEIGNEIGQQRPASYAPRHVTIEDEHGSVETVLTGKNGNGASVPHVSYNSGNNEWYTPADYIEAARHVMGDIDLDPASSAVANAKIKAAEYYSVDDNGLDQEWEGRVWMNPPYASDLIGKFCARLAASFDAGMVPEAIVLVNNATETAWFRLVADRASAICFPSGRVRFWSPDGTPGAPLQGQAVLYLGANVAAFSAAFSTFGLVLCPYSSNS